MNRFTLSRLSAGLLLAALAAGARAAEVTQATDTVQGRAPVASGVVINVQGKLPGVGPRVGDTLQVDYSFIDADGDAQGNTGIQWTRGGGAISGEMNSSYVTQTADANQSIGVQVTPKTDPANTDPSTGLLVSPATVTVVPANGRPSLGNFLAPDGVHRTWNQANTYCQSKGARLPTPSELQQLFLNFTSATHVNSGASAPAINFEMCSLYNWPLNGQCGGHASMGGYYWTSLRADANYHRLIVMNNGNNYYQGRDVDAYPVVCTR